MKFTLVLALLAPVIAAMPAADVEARDVEIQNTEGDLEALACADNLCVGVNKNKLCNDRVSTPKQQPSRLDSDNIAIQCRSCSGPSGKYNSGACGGLLWQ